MLQVGVNLNVWKFQLKTWMLKSLKVQTVKDHKKLLLTIKIHSLGENHLLEILSCSKQKLHASFFTFH